MSVAALEPLPTLLVACVGLALGSFLNVCIHRLPAGRSIVHPGSSCPKCGSPIRWYDNVPVVSWIVLRGRCRACGVRIPLRYPLVEILAALVLVGLWFYLGAGLAFLVAGPFALAMLVLFFTDYDERLLPDAVTLSGVVTGFAIAWCNPFLEGSSGRRMWLALSGAALGAGLLWGVGALYGRLRGVEAMGLGDVKLMAMVGAFTGPAGAVVTVFAASVVGALVGVALIPLRGGTLRDALPFGCFLAPAALAALLWGDRLVQAYGRLVLPPS
jgi:leader peptidase (prepilin peptidase) / N-methyltransferase